MSSTVHRLYIFTGKGGVGKTTLSRSFVKYLTSLGHEVVYITFKNQVIGHSKTGDEETQKRGLREISLDLEESAKGYIEKKLSSKLISTWIVKTPFFKALVNMIPGFSYLIFLGKILEMGKENPKLIVVLDAPASGHALTMVESTTNFQHIFESGIVFEDAAKMLSLLNDPKYTKINVISLPSIMSWQEATELKNGLKNRTPVEVDIILNNCLYPVVAEEIDTLPLGLKEKALNEKQLLESSSSEMRCTLNHSLGTSPAEIEAELVGSLTKLI